MTADRLDLATNADRDTVVAFIGHLFARNGHDPKPQAERAALLDRLLAAGYRAWLFRRHGAVLGYALTRDGGDHLFIRHFVVAPEARRGGVGRALFAAIVACAPRQPIRLDVMHGDAAALAFWTAMGFSAAAASMRCPAASA